MDLTKQYPSINSINVGNLIKNVRSGDVKYKSLLFYSPVVTTYNQNLLRESLINFHQTGRFVMPKFWVVMDENTYPTSNGYRLRYKENVVTANNIDKMIQIWGYIDGKTIGDYYNQCISEFISDFDHVVQQYIYQNRSRYKR